MVRRVNGEPALAGPQLGIGVYLKAELVYVEVMLSPEAKATLDNIAANSSALKGYYIEVTGFASSEGSTAHNKTLSNRRAQAVMDYLIENHNIPLRRIGQSYGFGELQPVAENTTREGREQNRRVEVKLLVSRGINQNVEVRQVTDN